MQRMKFFVIIFLVLVLVFLVSQIIALSEQGRGYAEQSQEAHFKASALEVENESLREDLDYFIDDENLSKELRAQFNYRLPSEELLILVPAKE